jgi:hypothetical protein
MATVKLIFVAVLAIAGTLICSESGIPQKIFHLLGCFRRKYGKPVFYSAFSGNTRSIHVTLSASEKGPNQRAFPVMVSSTESAFKATSRGVKVFLSTRLQYFGFRGQCHRPLCST